jgi:sulfite reductase alpha subunit-like flavoprotein
LISKKSADIYICGKKRLAEGVFKTLVEMFTKKGYNQYNAVNIITSMKTNNKYHEDIFS